MKFTIDRNALNTAIGHVIKAVPSRPTHPILANLHLVADDENQAIHLTGFDLSLGLRSTVGAIVVGESGEICLPAKLLNDIVSRLPDGAIALECKPDSSLVTLTSLSGSYELRGMSAEEYPELPTTENAKTITVSAETLLDGLGGVLYSVSTDELKLVLTGAHMSTSINGFEFASTDGHRLAVVETTDPGVEGLAVTIPSKALVEVQRAMSKLSGDDEVSIQFDESQAIFSIENQRITTRVLEGSFPAYRQLIPTTFATTATVDRRQLLSTLERIAVIADRKNNIVKFTFDSKPQTLTLSVDAADVGSAKESIECQISGNESLIIAFNVKYVIEALKNLPSTEVMINLNTPTSPAVLMPLGGTKSKHLVMPVQIRD